MSTETHTDKTSYGNDQNFKDDNPKNNTKKANSSSDGPTYVLGKTTAKVNKLFKWIFRTVYLVTLLSWIYWTVASDRYVSEAVVLVQNTENGSSASPADLLSMFSGGSGNKVDQLLLVEFLTSIDMLNKLDEELNLREHYSSDHIDPISRLWSKDVSTEWFYRYYRYRR